MIFDEAVTGSNRLRDGAKMTYILKGYCNGDRPMVKVIVRLYGSLKELLRGGETDRSLVLELRNETTLEQLLVSLAIPVEEVVVTLVNGIAEGKSYSIKDGDLVDVFPPPIGG